MLTPSLRTVQPHRRSSSLQSGRDKKERASLANSAFSSSLPFFDGEGGAKRRVGGSSPRMKQPHPSRRSRRSRCATLPTEDGGRDEDLRCLGTVGNDKRGHNQAVIASASEAIHRVDTKQESWTASSRSLLAMTNLKAGGRLVDENVGSQVWHDQCVGLLDPLARDDRAMAVGSILRRNRNCDACHILHSGLLISFYSLAVLLAG